MRQDISEVKKVLDKHSYSIDNIICDIMKKFKFKTLCWNAGIRKAEGYSVTEILSILIMLPLMLQNSVNSFYKSNYVKISKMQKDTIYRFKNNENIPWRKLLYKVAKEFQNLVNPTHEISGDTALILDDTIDARVGYKMENISFVKDHSDGRTKYGFKNLVLGFFDGKSTTPLDFSIHSEKKLDKKKRKLQYKKEVNEKSQGAKRREETKVDKITNGLAMLKRAVKNGFKAKYVLVDSWFTSFKFIDSVREIKKNAMHVIAGIRRDKRKYLYKGLSLNATQLHKKLQSEGEQKRCRKWNVRYFEVEVHYPGIGRVKLYFCRFTYMKKWRLFISTDPSLSFVQMMQIYGIRWTIEVLFRDLKQHLGLGTCQSRDFDAQIASATISMIIYTFLSYFRRINDYESLGEIFKFISQDITEKNLAERLWQLFEDLLQVIIDSVSKYGKVDIASFKNSPEYNFIKNLVESSFLSYQLFQVNNAV